MAQTLGRGRGESVFGALLQWQSQRGLARSSVQLCENESAEEEREWKTTKQKVATK